MNKKMAVAVGSLLLSAHVASAFPTWMGVYGKYARHVDDGNPGAFTILMNQGYDSLRAEVGIQVNNGAWKTYPMSYLGIVDNNTRWTLHPSESFPVGSTVKYYFHGYDGSTNNIYDSRNGQNYSFVAAQSPVISRLGDGAWHTLLGSQPGCCTQYNANAWVDFKLKNLGAPTAVGIVYTEDNWQTWKSGSATFESDLGNGEQQWGVDIEPVGSMTYFNNAIFSTWQPVGGASRSIHVKVPVYVKYAIFYEVGGKFYWDNNGGQDHVILIGKP